ncbi:MAG: hypothetical protein N2606_06200 [Candidatus Omnitrophica bacterium]|nr:hypothetical protein [Candidatus Omnitrophota bacterium]
MNYFRYLFGINASEIKKTCIIVPLLPKNLDSCFEKIYNYRGLLYSVINTQNCSIIRTGVGAGLCGDAILYLKETQASNLILFGSCGLVRPKNNLKIGSLVAPEKSFNLESFTNLLRKNISWQNYYPNKILLKKIFTAIEGICKVTSATIGSIYLESQYLELFKKKKVDIVEMEASAFFSAAKKIKRKAAALFYITDIVPVKPFCQPLNTQEKITLNKIITNTLLTLCHLS